MRREGAASIPAKMPKSRRLWRATKLGATNRATGAVARHPLQVFPATEAAGRKPHNPGGRLSEGTLTAMLKVQELK